MLSATTAYPSMVARSNPGTSTSLTMEVAEHAAGGVPQGHAFSSKRLQLCIQPGESRLDRVPLGETAHAHIVGCSSADVVHAGSRLNVNAMTATHSAVTNHVSKPLPGLDSGRDAAGPHAGTGHDNPNKDPLIGGFTLSRQDRDDLIEFLKSLTDDKVIHDPRFADPWPHAN